MNPQLSRARQRGIGALGVSLLLLFASSVVVFYLNRGVIFEQRTSANQMRSTMAFEVAEAGIEWATGMLNRPYDIQANCSFDTTTNISFRRKYIQTGFSSGNSNVAVAATTYPGCKLDGTTFYCNCPTVPSSGEAVASPTVPTGVSSTLPSFTVAFSSVIDPVTGTADATAVRITSTGCTAQSGVCKPTTASASTTGSSDASATVSVILKLNPTLRAMPSSALTCGTSCTIGGSYNIYNYEVASNGYLVNAGSTISSGNGVTYNTIPGQPVQNAMIQNDSSLSALSSSDTTCSNSAMFKAYFGTTISDYAASPDTKTITSADGCSGSGSASSCGAAINTAYNDGWRNFYFPDGMSINNSAPFAVLGSTSSGGGVNLVSPGTMNLNGGITVNGLLFSNDATNGDLGTGSATINGAMITCAGYDNNGNGTLSYNSNALGGTGLRPGIMVRVPGSWRDF
jgi:hypothetical protein